MDSRLKSCAAGLNISFGCAVAKLPSDSLSESPEEETSVRCLVVGRWEHPSRWGDIVLVPVYGLPGESTYFLHCDATYKYVCIWNDPRIPTQCVQYLLGTVCLDRRSEENIPQGVWKLWRFYFLYNCLTAYYRLDVHIQDIYHQQVVIQSIRGLSILYRVLRGAGPMGIGDE